jgi:hypothetical protein
LSKSVVSLETVKIKLINLFILSEGYFGQSLNRVGAAPRLFA